MMTNLKRHSNRFIALLVSLTLLLSSIVTTNVFAGTSSEQSSDQGKYNSLKDTSPDAQAIINYGKGPGLGIKKLHEQGYTGKGVTIAYIDQPCLTTHEQFRELNLHYSRIRETDSGMQNAASTFHGTTVLSILSGNTIGVAPESEVYYVASPSWQLDASSNAEALRRLITLNKTLPDEKKIKILATQQPI
jgi:subtilisin family serine protease